MYGQQQWQHHYSISRGRVAIVTGGNGASALAWQAGLRKPGGDCRRRTQ